MKRRPLIYAVAGMAIACFTTGCSHQPRVSVTNQANVELRNLVLSGSGFSERIESLAPGAQRSFSPPVRGESGVRVQFDAAGAHHDSGEQGYFEAGDSYLVTVIVDQQMKVTVDAKIH